VRSPSLSYKNPVAGVEIHTGNILLRETGLTPREKRGRISFPLSLHERTSHADRDVGILAVMPTSFRSVDPRTLRVPSSRPTGADLVKLHRQITQFGASSVGMPPPWVYEGTDGELVLFNGVTRATRIAKLAPGMLIQVEVIGKLRAAFDTLPTVGDLLP
jgi:hypothetical protein